MTASESISESRLVDEFLELVEIDSVPFEEAKVAQVLERKLREIDFSVINDHTGPSTGNLIARWGGSASSRPPIVLSAHMDTVEPGRRVRPVVQDGIVRSSGDTVLGADCKASIAAILEGVRVVAGAGGPRPKLELLFTYGEERGHIGAKALDPSLLEGRACFVFDAVAPIGTVITRAPGQFSLRVRLQGRGAHAGVAPETGIDALVATSRAIARMPLGRLDLETTANIGLIRGGTARNTVPPFVEIEGEARSLDRAKLVAQVDAMSTIMREEAEKLGATLDLQIKQEYQAFHLDPHAPAVLLAASTFRRLNLPVELTATGGGSDANELNQKGLETVVLGTGMVAPHTVEERISVADLVLMAQLVVELITAT